MSIESFSRAACFHASALLRAGLLVGAIFGGLVPLAMSAAAEDEEELKAEMRETWYVSSVVAGDSGFRMSHYWSKGSSLRAETMVGIHPVVTVVRGDRYWVYDELTRQGIEIVRSAKAVAQDATRTRPFATDFEDLLARSGERIDTTSIGGLAVEVWRVSNSKGRRTVWVMADAPRVPLRVENFDRQSAQTATLDYSNWATGVDLSDRAFEPPTDVEFQKFTHAEYLAKTLEGQGRRAPILFPKLLYGASPR